MTPDSNGQSGPSKHIFLMDGDESMRSGSKRMLES